jgi:hypothetical protein
MNRLTPAQIEMLLGGYATGTLSAEENDALMRAALENQALFDALMDEEALRETLADAATRDELLRALRPAEAKAKWWRTPWPWAAVATALVAVAVLMMVRQQRPAETAMVNRPAAPAQVAQARPEPVPSEIAVPKSLRASDAATGPAAVVPAAPAQAAAPPPPPAPAVQAPPPALERLQAYTGGDLLKESKGRADKLNDTAQPAKKAESVSVSSMAEMITVDAEPDVLAVQFAFQMEDGTWRPIVPGAAAPARRPLRLTVTSGVRGRLSTDPPVAASQMVEVGRPATLLIAARGAGDLAFRLTLEPAPAAAPGGASLLSGNMTRQNAPRAEARAKVRAAEADSAGVVPASRGNLPARPLASREIRLKIE